MEAIEQGIMIETPAAVMMSEQLAARGGLFQYRNKRSDTVYPGNGPSEYEARHDFYDPHPSGNS